MSKKTEREPEEHVPGLNRFVTDYPTSDLTELFEEGWFDGLTRAQQEHQMQVIVDALERAKMLPRLYAEYNKAHPDHPVIPRKNPRAKPFAELIDEYNAAHPDDPPLILPEPSEEAKQFAAEHQ